MDGGVTAGVEGGFEFSLSAVVEGDHDLLAGVYKAVDYEGVVEVVDEFRGGVFGYEVGTGEGLLIARKEEISI